MKYTTLAAATIAALLSAPSVYADALRTFNISANTENHATVNGVLTFDFTADQFLSSLTYVTVSGESGSFNGNSAASWNGLYNIINNSALASRGETPVNPFLNLQDKNGRNLYLKFDINGYNLSLSNTSVVGYFTLKDHFVSSTVAAVPEPETYAMMMVGLGLLGFMVKRKKTA